MHARIARYEYSGDIQEIAAKAESGLLPILQSTPGFKAYTVITTDSEIITFSGWDTAEQAEAAATTALAWVDENLADDIDLKETIFGDIVIATALGIGTKAGATA